tara:strand:- start:227 stop:1555 length:1329 start_codon:yes stop_codon:yes gene_type:complete
MQSTKKLNFTLKDQKKLKFFLYLFFFFFFFFFTYLCIPKLLNFSPELIKENLKNNNNININKISKVSYKIFPTPRLSLPNSDFTIGEGVLEVSNSDIEIILDISKILNFKKINYKKLLVNKGTSKINLNYINLLLTLTNKNKLTFSENNIIFFQKEKFLFEISNAFIKINQHKKKNIILNGNFLNNKIFIKLNSLPKSKNNLIIKIPELDIATSVFFKKNNFDEVSGSFNLEVFNNFLKFNFIKGRNIKLTNGFIRSKLVNASLKGEVTVKPNFFSKIDFETSNLNMKKLIPVIQKAFFLNNSNNLPIIKKINGVFNFKSSPEGKITNKNGEVSFENFKVGKNKPLFFNAKIIEYGKKGKVQFNLIKNIKSNRDLPKKIEIKGFLIPSNSKVIFEKFLIDGNELSAKKTKDYESKFADSVIRNSLVNIFYKDEIDKYFKNLF